MINTEQLEQLRIEEQIAYIEYDQSLKAVKSHKEYQKLNPEPIHQNFIKTQIKHAELDSSARLETYKNAVKAINKFLQNDDK